MVLHGIALYHCWLRRAGCISRHLSTLYSSVIMVQICHELINSGPHYGLIRDGHAQINAHFRIYICAFSASAWPSPVLIQLLEYSMPSPSAPPTIPTQRTTTTTTKQQQQQQQRGGLQCIWILLDCRATDWVTVHQFGVSVHQRFVRVEQQQCKTSWSVIECINSGWSTHSSILSPSSSSPSWPSSSSTS